MKRHFFISLITAAVLAGQVSAGTMGPVVIPVKDWAWVGSLAVGPVWAHGGKTQTFSLAPEVEETYVARKSTNALASGEVFVGMQKSLGSQWLGQLGLALAATGNDKFQGVIWDDANPKFENYSYQYKVRNSRVAVKGKLLFDNDYPFLPWISASLGVGFNRANGFTNTPLIFEALPTTNFTDHTQTAFTYTLGAGVQRSINDHWQAGVGYEFADWGKSELGRALGQTLNTGLVLNHLYTNGVLFNLTYIN